MFEYYQPELQMLHFKSYLPLDHPDESGPVTRFLLDPILGIITQHNREVKALEKVGTQLAGPPHPHLTLGDVVEQVPDEALVGVVAAKRGEKRWRLHRTHPQLRPRLVGNILI